MFAANKQNLLKQTNKTEREKKEKRKTPELKSKYLKKLQTGFNKRMKMTQKSVSKLENKSI